MAGVQAQTQAREEDAAGEGTHGAADPALDPIDVASKQSRRLVSAMVEKSIAQLSRMRDRVDGCIRQMQAREIRVLDEIERPRVDLVSTNEAEQLMSEYLDRMVEQLGEDVPSTVTALRPRERARP